MAGDNTSDDVRGQIISAAHDELSRWGIDRFNLAAMAGRHGFDRDLVERYWKDEQSLIRDVLLQRPSRDIAIPDTGGLRTDLRELATSMAAYVTSEHGRSLLSAYVIRIPEHSNVEARRTAWNISITALGPIFERARRRGEISDAVQGRTALEMLFAPLNMRVLFTGEPIDEQYCHTLADWVWRAATTPTPPPG